MLPEGARRAPNEGLEASGAPLGAMWAQSGRQGGAQAASASVHLEKTRFRSEGVSNLAFRPFARTAKKRRNKANQEE